MSATEDTIDQLANNLAAAKTAEELARKARLKIEEDLIATLGVKMDGSSTFRGHFFAVTTTGKLTRSVDAVKVWVVKDEIEQELFESLFKFSPSLNTKLYKDLKTTNLQAFKSVSQAVTTRPAKPSVSIKELSQ